MATEMTHRPPSRTIAPYGTWESAIGADRLTAFIVAIADLRVAGGRLYWTETMAAHGGRAMVVTPDGQGGITPVSAAGHHVRSRVHEYGGTPFVIAGEWIVYSNYADQRLYAHRPGNPAVPITEPGFRYADGMAAADGRSILCVREDHTRPGEPRNTIVRLDLNGLGGAEPHVRETVLFAGTDFVAYPRLSKDGRRLAFIGWDHPHRPWDSTRLLIGDVDPATGDLRNVRAVAGGEGESVLEPQWDTDGALYFVSDRTGWWNLHRLDDDQGHPVAMVEGDLTGPLWTLGVSSYALTGDGRVVAAFTRFGVDRLMVLDLATGAARDLDLPFVGYGSLQMMNPGTAAMIARAADDETRIIHIDVETGKTEVVRRPGTFDLDHAWISRPEAIWFPTSPGPDGTARQAHAFFYPPCNPDFQAPDGGKPPLIVMLHGGPTSHTTPALSLGRQYWTSRGFAVVDVNYGGSTSFGRAYRERLYRNWGVVDLQDLVAAVDHLVDSGRVDPNRIAIRGGSAGGFLVLAGLAFTDRFGAGVNYFGVADIEMLLKQTHKFESRYGDALVGPLPASLDICRARSPIHHLDRFKAPLLTVQGLDDRVVPPNQSEMIVNALKARGVPVAYLPFEGEQHGLRKPENIVRAQEAELSFYGQIFGFTPAGDVPPVEIANMPGNAS